MLDQFRDTSLRGTIDMLSMMMGMEGSISETALPPEEIYVSGIVSFRSSTVSGLVSLRFARDTAVALVSMMLGMEADEVDDETMFDGVGEMTNIVCGQLKVDFSRELESLDISIPSIIHGKGHRINVFHGAESGEYAVACDSGTIALRIEMCSDK
ncbi:chemotaxis protein CheX [Myxococcota bacterium]|nr:chemotaxis protein CheX [Myxococcota bacterium]MBU1379421.1 chemotaxis protein CheX [Myxococcota bacterium]MBU1497624.1 chemotaxis protein CheX [Myxococcota bacterium]